mmetsp:Transcript_19709/g.31615  ORF Transcript_19709/g.31615 Transcript_19709/m.31615 type:complete len:84 (+) Transcript_19709:992-1243(+)
MSPRQFPNSTAVAAQLSFLLPTPISTFTPNLNFVVRAARRKAGAIMIVSYIMNKIFMSARKRSHLSHYDNLTKSHLPDASASS